MILQLPLQMDLFPSSIIAEIWDTFKGEISIYMGLIYWAENRDIPSVPLKNIPLWGNESKAITDLSMHVKIQ